jgi:hypothetical protein
MIHGEKQIRMWEIMINIDKSNYIYPCSPVPINSNIKVGDSGKFFPLAILIALT